MNITELKAEVAKRQRMLQSAKTGGMADEIAHAEKKLKQAEDALNKADESEAGKVAKVEIDKEDMNEDNIKPKRKARTPKSKTVKKPKAEKETTKAEPEKETKAEISEDKKEQKVGKHFTLLKVGEGVYTLKNDKTGKIEDVEINKKGDKWHIVCLTKDKMTFNTLHEAVSHIAKTRYASEVKELVKIKRDRKKAQEKFKEKHPSGETTPVNDFRTATKKIKEKLEEAIDAGESIEKQIESLKNLIKQLTELLNKLEKESKNQ